MKVLITGGNGDIAQATAKLLLSELPGDIIVYAPGKKILDVTFDYHADKEIGKFKPDVLINNAGFIEPERIDSGHHFAIDNWIKQIDVNLIGTYLCSRAAIRYGAKQIINIGSSAGEEGKAEWSAYCAAKAGVKRFTESLYAEGHNATYLCIGRTKTKMRAALFGEEDPNTLLAPEEVARTLLQIILNPEEYAGKSVDLYVS